MEPVTDTAVTFASQIEHLGIVGILALVGFWLGYLYMRERKENIKLHAEIMSNSREMTTCMVGVQSVVASHTEVLHTVADLLKRLDNKGR